MPREAKVGTVKVAKNGYSYTKTKDGWRLTHHIIAEKHFNIKLTSDDRVAFKDRDPSNLDPNNIVVKKKVQSKANRIKYLKAKIEAYQAELSDLESSS